MEVLTLKQNMRLDHDEDSSRFSEWLLDVGRGKNSDQDGMVTLPSSITVHDPQALIHAIYGDMGSDPNCPPPPEYFANRTILSARNRDVDIINAEVLNRMGGEARTYYSADRVILEKGSDRNGAEGYPVEFLRGLSASGLPLGELTVKVGCPLILLRNLAPHAGLCNGTRMVLERMSDRVLEVKILGGDYDGNTAFIPRISLIPSTSTTDFTFLLSRRQFPVRLAFAMSINKAQGQSVKHVGIDLRTPVFSHGQLYVALSRATSSRRVKVLLPSEGGNKTLNVVYPEVLL